MPGFTNVNQTGSWSLIFFDGGVEGSLDGGVLYLLSEYYSLEGIRYQGGMHSLLMGKSTWVMKQIRQVSQQI